MSDRDRVRAFLDHDWRAAESHKERYWAEWKTKHGPAAGLRVAEALRAHARSARPDWPSEAERREDLETHLRLIEVIGRVGRVAR